MKKYGLVGLTTAMALTLAACGNGEEDTSTNGEETTNEASENNTTDDPTNSDTDQDQDEGTETNEDTESAWYEDLNFAEFELEAEYDNEEYDVQYDYNNGQPQAEIEDTRDGAQVQLEGEEALAELEPILSQLDIDAQSTEDELIQASIDAFMLDETYNELEVEVEFFNDDEVEAEDEQE